MPPLIIDALRSGYRLRIEKTRDGFFCELCSFEKQFHASAPDTVIGLNTLAERYDDYVRAWADFDGRNP